MKVNETFRKSSAVWYTLYGMCVRACLCVCVSVCAYVEHCKEKANCKTQLNFIALFGYQG